MRMPCGPAWPPLLDLMAIRCTQERAAVSSVWCISADAAAAGKVEDILRLFNWCYSDEGKMLYNYGIEGVSYDMVDGTAVLKPVMVANGFVDYRSLGCEFDPSAVNGRPMLSCSACLLA